MTIQGSIHEKEQEALDDDTASPACMDVCPCLQAADVNAWIREKDFVGTPAAQAQVWIPSQ